jgi:hypothetical protein
MGLTEHQIRLSKGVTAKFVQRKDLATLVKMSRTPKRKKATVAVAFGNLV